MHEGFRERRVARQAAAAEHDWQARHDSYVDLIETARTFSGVTAPDGLLLASGERVFLQVAHCALVEERRGQGTYVGHSQGFSVPVARVGGRQIRYRVGATKGHYVQGTPTPTAIDTGTTVITSTRVLFQGTRQTRECPFATLVGFHHDADGSTTFSLSNRATPVTVHYGTTAAPTFDFRLELALAHYRGSVDELVSGLEADLAAIDAERPPALAGPSGAAAPTGTTPAVASEPEASASDASAPVTPPPGPVPSVPQGPAPAAPPSAPAPPPGSPPPAPVPVPTSTDVAAGWYPDPWRAAPLRWWDGRAWSWQTAVPGQAPPAAG